MRVSRVASSAWYMRNDLQVFPHLYFRIDDIAFDNGGNVFLRRFNLQSVYFARNIKNAWRFNAFLMVFL